MSDERRLGLAIELLNGGRHDLAERELRALLAADPENAEAHALLAMALVSRWKGAEALAAAEEARRLGPGQPLVLQAQVEVHLRLAHRREGEATARAALAVMPFEPRLHALQAGALLNRAVFFRRRRLARQALDAADAGLALDAGHVECLLQRAQALSRLGRVAEARDASAAALRRAPEAQAGHAVRGIVELAAGNRSEGRAGLREALRLDPQDPWVQTRLGLFNPAQREHAAYFVVAVDHRRSVRAAYAILLVAVAVGAVRATRGGGTFFPIVLPLWCGLFPLLARSHLDRRRPHLIEELRTQGLTPRERANGRLSVRCWIFLSVWVSLVALFA